MTIPSFTRIVLAPVLFGFTSIVQVIVALVVVGLIWWLVDSQLPLPPPIKVVIRVILVLVVCLWLLRLAGLL